MKKYAGHLWIAFIILIGLAGLPFAAKQDDLMNSITEGEIVDIYWGTYEHGQWWATFITIKGLGNDGKYHERGRRVWPTTKFKVGDYVREVNDADTIMSGPWLFEKVELRNGGE